jgi:predicted RNA-binding Zn-ribbon protein involved in translation (DUF1610 family)
MKKNELKNCCPTCGCELSLNELELQKCNYCEINLDIKSFENIDDKCFYCGKPLIVRTDASKYEKGFTICDKCTDKV